MKQAFTRKLQTAADYLARQDEILAPVIATSGLPDFLPHTDYYGALVNSIIGQQLSVKAAASIKGRFKELFGGDFPAPSAILEKSTEELRSVGLSGAKVNYVRDLADHILDGRIHFNDLDLLTNDEITAKLTDVKGIGEWTVHMFLMFCMGRLDVLPVGDLGVRNGVGLLYGFESAPTPAQVATIADEHGWHPYESVASWYVWRSLENAPN